MKGERRYRAQAGDSLKTLLGEEAEDAVARGSVFVDGKRATSLDQSLAIGSEVRVARARPALHCPLLGELGGLIAVEKPPELPTEPDRSGRASVRSALAQELDEDESELHAVGRLDVGVSGVVLFARGADAKKRASVLREQGKIHRRYVAITLRVPEPERGLWELDVVGKVARTRYATMTRLGATGALLVLELSTGRKHQIRIHAAAAGVPLLGDHAHGGARRVTGSDGRVLEVPRVALHSLWVAIGDGKIVSPVPTDMLELWQWLGGSDSDWELVRALGVC